MRVRAAGRLVGTVLVLAAGVAGCSATVAGTGHKVTLSPSSHSNDFPSTTAPSTQTESSTASVPTVSSSSAPPTGGFSCPTITYPNAHLRFDCITGGLTLETANKIWPVSLSRSVEASGWVLEEGAGNWGDPGSQSSSNIAFQVRSRMVGDAGYGTAPALTTDLNADTTVGGVPAHVLQTTITINPVWAKSRGTKVTSEKLWIVVLKVSRTDDALWYTSIPNLASQLWAKVPAIIKTIRVT